MLQGHFQNALKLGLASIPKRNAWRRRCISSTPAYEGHIPLNWFENTFLAVGSAVMALADPRRGGAFVKFQSKFFCIKNIC